MLHYFATMHNNATLHLRYINAVHNRIYLLQLTLVLMHQAVMYNNVHEWSVMCGFVH